ncbi:hypothetical protein Tco_0511195 [Tanacetum coccineum]
MAPCLYPLIMSLVRPADFETDFPTIVYNDASTSNQNVSSEPTSSGISRCLHQEEIAYTNTVDSPPEATIRKRIRELELTGNEEHPPNGDIIYDYPPAYDEYEDEEWYSWMTGAGVTYDPTGVKIQDSLQGGQAVDFVMVTGGPVASMATLPFVPEVQRRKGDEASNWVMEPHANNDTVDLGLYVKNGFFNKIGLVDCGPQDQMGRKDYEGPTTTSLDVLKSLSSKIATTKCVGAELFERFNLIANSDRFMIPY